MAVWFRLLGHGLAPTVNRLGNGLSLARFPPRRPCRARVSNGDAVGAIPAATDASARTLTRNPRAEPFGVGAIAPFGARFSERHLHHLLKFG